MALSPYYDALPEEDERAGYQDYRQRRIDERVPAPTIDEDVQDVIGQNLDLNRRMAAADLPMPGNTFKTDTMEGGLDPLGERAMRGFPLSGPLAGTDTSVMDFLKETLYADPEYRYGITPPRRYIEQRMDRGSELDPQEFIGQQLAGDVVSLPAGHMLDASQRLYDASRSRTTPVGGMYGQESINQFGGRHSPYLDLLNVYDFNTRRPYGR